MLPATCEEYVGGVNVFKFATVNVAVSVVNAGLAVAVSVTLPAVSNLKLLAAVVNVATPADVTCEFPEPPVFVKDPPPAVLVIETVQGPPVVTVLP